MLGILRDIRLTELFEARKARRDGLLVLECRGLFLVLPPESFTACDCFSSRHTIGRSPPTVLATGGTAAWLLHVERTLFSQELLDTIDWPSYISSQSKGVILGLLAGRETERLGGNATNLLAVSDRDTLFFIRFFSW